MPISDIDVRIDDGDTGQRELTHDEIGEIVVRAPQLMLGYWQRPQETSEMLRDGWLFTGDLGYFNQDGYLAIVDRKKVVIKPRGSRCGPARWKR